MSAGEFAGLSLPRSNGKPTPRKTTAENIEAQSITPTPATSAVIGVLGGRPLFFRECIGCHWTGLAFAEDHECDVCGKALVVVIS